MLFFRFLQQHRQRFADGGRTFAPCPQGIFQGIPAIRGARFLDRRCRTAGHIERNAQIAVLGADFLQRGHMGKAEFVLEFPVGVDDPLDVVVGQETLGAFAGDFVDRVDEEDLALPDPGLGRPANDDTGFHCGVVE